MMKQNVCIRETKGKGMRMGDGQGQQLEDKNEDEKMEARDGRKKMGKQLMGWDGRGRGKG